MDMEIRQVPIGQEQDDNKDSFLKSILMLGAKVLSLEKLFGWKQEPVVEADQILLLISFGKTREYTEIIDRMFEEEFRPAPLNLFLSSGQEIRKTSEGAPVATFGFVWALHGEMMVPCYYDSNVPEGWYLNLPWQGDRWFAVHRIQEVA